jgi:bis(5'-nucleosidyl)-tetraphosphatase
MVWEHSAGIIPFQIRNGKRKYLMLLSNLAKNAYWEFPKGLIEKGERAQDAAIREFQEEAGIQKFKLIPGFKRVLKYFYRRNGEVIAKTVTYFLARVQSKKVTISSESKDYKWVTKEEAASMATYRSILDLLSEAEDFLNKLERESA